MITKTAHIILLFTLLLSSLCSCQSNEDIEQFIQQPKPVLLDLKVMLAAPQDDSNKPECERVKTLRLIVIDKDSKKVELNRLLDYKTTTDNFEYRTRLKTTQSVKCIYALANVENILRDKMNWENETMIIENLSLLVLDSEIKESYQSNSDGYLQIGRASCRERV